MQRAILAVSPNLQFLEQIRSHLEEGGRYRVQGVTSGGDALALVKNSYFDLAILDAESSDVPFVPFTRDLVAAQPGLKLLIFPPQNNPHHPVLAGLVANGFLKKPFFTPEVSRALKGIFDDKLEDLPPEPEPINDLAELWMKRPEVGFNRVEQLLGSTTAQTGLLIARGQVIAGSGPTDDATIQQVLNLLDLHHLDKSSLELLRFITLENGTGEILIYASQLIHDVILVLFYPPTTSILLARQEVFQVKQEFKEAYPTTGELRRDLNVNGEKQTVPQVEPVVENLPATDEPSEIETPISEELKSLEDEIESDDLDSVLSQVELKNLDSLLSEMPPPDPDESEESPVVEPAPLGDLDISKWMPLAENDTVAVDSAGGKLETGQEESPTSEALAETEAELVPPPLPEEFLRQFVPEETISSQPTDGVIKPEAESSDFLFDLPWDEKNGQVKESTLTGEEFSNESESSVESLPAESIAGEETVKSEDDAFNAWLEEIKEPASASPENEGITELSQGEVFPPLPEEWFTPPVETGKPLEKSERVASDEIVDSTEAGPELPESDVFPPLPEDWFTPSVETVNPSESSESVESDGFIDTPEVVPELIPTSVTSEMDSSAFINETMISAKTPEPEPVRLPELPAESYNSQLSSEPGTSPLGIRNFRFHYTCLLIPRDGKQFLTRDLNERLSFLLPQLHLEYGWHLTGISIRPQYMLWSISVPLDTCPIKIIQEIRRRTSAHLFSNFSFLNPENAQSDFWAPGFLALSGSTSPTVGMVYDFIAQTRQRQNTGD